MIDEGLNPSGQTSSDTFRTGADLRPHPRLSPLTVGWLESRPRKSFSLDSSCQGPKRLSRTSEEEDKKITKKQKSRSFKTKFSEWNLIEHVKDNDHQLGTDDIGDSSRLIDYITSPSYYKENN